MDQQLDAESDLLNHHLAALLGECFEFADDCLFERRLVFFSHLLEQAFVVNDFTSLLYWKSHKSLSCRDCRAVTAVFEHHLEKGDTFVEICGRPFHHKDVLQVVDREALKLLSDAKAFYKEVDNEDSEERLQIGSLNLI